MRSCSFVVTKIRYYAYDFFICAWFNEERLITCIFFRNNKRFMRKNYISLNIWCNRTEKFIA